MWGELGGIEGGKTVARKYGMREKQIKERQKDANHLVLRPSILPVYNPSLGLSTLNSPVESGIVHR